MLALRATIDEANVINAEIKSDKIVTVAAAPLAGRLNHAVAHHDSRGNPWIPRILANACPL